MANGLLGFADLSANTNTTLYTVTSGLTGSFSVNFTNRNEGPITVSLGICASSTPANGEYLLYKVEIDGNGSLERSGLVAQGGKLVVVNASSVGVSAQVYGYEA